MTSTFVDVGTAKIRVERSGKASSSGAVPLLFVHGWPLSGKTWRKVVPALAEKRECIVIDLPGAGETEWSESHDFSFTGQAAALLRSLNALQLERVDILAQDTGATISRKLAFDTATTGPGGAPRVRKLAMINTEIARHRPPWIDTFQKLVLLPGSRLSFKMLLSSPAFLHSGMGFGGCFVDKSLIDGEFRDLFVRPLLADARRLEGQIRYLRGIDWAMVDDLPRLHAGITSETVFIWGVQDPTFPIERARGMEKELPRCAGFRLVEGAKLLPHDEKPADVVAHVDAFLDALLDPR